MINVYFEQFIIRENLSVDCSELNVARISVTSGSVMQNEGS